MKQIDVNLYTWLPASSAAPASAHLTSKIASKNQLPPGIQICLQLVWVKRAEGQALGAGHFAEQTDEAAGMIHK
eukprot:scaffold29300_cov19-Tisochrysis_lutea.AAC.3